MNSVKMGNSGARFILMILFVLATRMLYAQAGKLPPFKMLRVNGKVFSAHDLPLGKPILLVYFSPDCGHCQQMMRELFNHSSDFNKASVAFITYLPVKMVSEFEKEYGLGNRSNMYAGTEGTTFFVRNYYRITDIPFAVLYTKDGDLVASYEKEVNLKALVEKLKAL